MLIQGSLAWWDGRHVIKSMHCSHRGGSWIAITATTSRSHNSTADIRALLLIFSIKATSERRVACDLLCLSATTSCRVRHPSGLVSASGDRESQILVATLAHLLFFHKPHELEQSMHTPHSLVASRLEPTNESQPGCQQHGKICLGFSLLTSMHVPTSTTTPQTSVPWSL